MSLRQRDLTLGEYVLEVMSKVFHNYEHIELVIELELVHVDQFNEEVRHLRQLSQDLNLSDRLHTVVFVLVNVLDKLYSYFISGRVTGCPNHLAVATLTYHFKWGIVFRNLSPFGAKVKGSLLFLFYLRFNLLHWMDFYTETLFTFAWGGVIKHVHFEGIFIFINNKINWSEY